MPVFVRPLWVDVEAAEAYTLGTRAPPFQRMSEPKMPVSSLTGANGVSPVAAGGV